MDCWASLEHKISYKKISVASNENILNELVECAEMGSAIDIRMEKLQNYTQLLIEEEE